MTIQEKRHIILDQIEHIPDEFLEEVATFLKELKNKIDEKKYISDEIFQQNLKQTSEKYTSVWQALA